MRTLVTFVTTYKLHSPKYTRFYYLIDTDIKPPLLSLFPDHGICPDFRTHTSRMHLLHAHARTHTRILLYIYIYPFLATWYAFFCFYSTFSNGFRKPFVAQKPNVYRASVAWCQGVQCAALCLQLLLERVFSQFLQQHLYICKTPSTHVIIRPSYNHISKHLHLFLHSAGVVHNSQPLNATFLPVAFFLATHVFPDVKTSFLLSWFLSFQLHRRYQYEHNLLLFKLFDVNVGFYLLVMNLGLPIFFFLICWRTLIVKHYNCCRKI